MSKLLYCGAATALLLTIGATQVTAQEANPVQPGAQPAQPVPANAPTFRAKQVLGSKVFINNNTGIGTVEDLVFDDHGNLEYLIVSDGGKLVTVPWQAVKFDAAQQSAVVSISVEQYKVIPTYTTTTYPAFFAPDYRTTTYKYYNLTPGQLRRFERRGAIP